MLIYFHIFGHLIPAYGIMITTGIILANIIAAFVIRRYHMDFNDFIILEAYTFLGGFIGAKLLYLWVSRSTIQWERFFIPKYFNELMQSGFVFYGGLIGGFIALILARKIHHITVFIYFQRLIFLVPLVHGFGRIGCFLAGCCYGKPYTGHFAVTFPSNSLAPSGISLFPVQLFEACFLFLIFIIDILFALFKKQYTVEVYLICYSILRFILEYFRYDSVRGSFLFFSTSQWISIILLIGTVAYLIRKIYNKKGC